MIPWDWLGTDLFTATLAGKARREDGPGNEALRQEYSANARDESLFGESHVDRGADQGIHGWGSAARQARAVLGFGVADFYSPVEITARGAFANYHSLFAEVIGNDVVLVFWVNWAGFAYSTLTLKLHSLLLQQWFRQNHLLKSNFGFGKVEPSY